MAIHGLKMDLNAVLLFVAAVTLSVFITGEPVSRYLFTALIVVLFFIKGMSLKPDRIKSNTHKWREVLVGLSLSYILFPLAVLTSSIYLEGAAELAVLAVGFSAASVGPAIVWTGRAKAEPDTSSILTVIGVFPIIPLLYLTLTPVFSIDPLVFAQKAFVFAIIPFLTGSFIRNMETDLLGDVKHHLSRTALWLVMLVFLVQFQAIASMNGLGFIYELALVFLFFMGLTAVMSYLGYAISRHVGIMERRSRSVSFFTGSKSFGVALLIASQLGSTALLYVASYFLARQIVMELLVRQSNEEILFSNFSRDHLRPRLF